MRTEGADLAVTHLAGGEAGHHTVLEAQGRVDVIDRALSAAASSRSEMYHRRTGEFEHEIQSCQPTTNYKRWLEEGLEAVPEQYQKLAELNELLANKPWNVKAEHINDLTTGLTKVAGFPLF